MSAATIDPEAKLLILLQWRAGLRLSEALNVAASDFSLDADRPTLRVRMGKGWKSRIVPVPPRAAIRFRLLLGSEIPPVT